MDQLITSNKARVFLGAVVHSLNRREIQALPRAVLVVSSAGLIELLEPIADDSLAQEVLASKGISIEDTDLVVLKPGQWLMPGFIDTHTHAPQFLNMGVGQQYELLDWLANVTFPAEAQFADTEFARKSYKKVVSRVISSGTTTCCYYGTLHLESTKILAELVHESGQRAFVGKCNMNRNAAPFYQEPSTAESLSATEDLVAYIKALPRRLANATPLVHPILTPRFAISCSDDLLSSLGHIAAADPTLAIQTHISENPSEIDFTLSLFPDQPTYAHVYHAHGLLRHNTILAHGVHLNQEELDLIKEQKAGISHCPTSNFNLRSGVAKVGKMLDMDIKVGLGTDVSGGFAPSILTAIQHASMASKVLTFQSSTPPPPNTDASTAFEGRHLPIPTLLYLATLGGAEVCDLADVTGNFATGKEFDALLVSVREETGNPGVWFREGVDLLEAMLERFLFGGDDRNIAEVWVAGRLIGGKRRV